MPLPLSPRLFPILLVALLLAGPAAGARAQQQESGLYQRIMHPDMGMTYNPANKRFAGHRAAQGKTASTRSFAFGRAARVKSYRAGGFNGSRDYRANHFSRADRSAAAGRKGFAETDRAFSTRAVDTREARDARKALPVPASDRARAFLVPGKRQGALDEQSRARPMSIDEVRELLNKSR